MVAAFLSTMIPVTIYTLLQPPVYQAESRILVKPGRENIYVSPVGGPEGAHPPIIVQRVDEVISSEIQIIRSRDLIGRVLGEMGIANVFPPTLPEHSVAADVGESYPGKVLDKLGITGGLARSVGVVAASQEAPSASLAVAVSRALSDLSVRRISGTDVIQVQFRSHQAAVPAKFVATLVDLYLERHLEVHRSKNSYDFFREQSNQLKQKLETAAKRLADFKKKYGIVNFEQLKSISLSRYTETEAAIKRNKAGLIVTQRRIDKLREELERTPKHKYTGQDESADSAVINELKTRLANLEMEKLSLMQKYKAGDPKIETRDELIAKVKEMLEAEQEAFHGSVRTGQNASYQKLEIELLMAGVAMEEHKSRESALNKQLITYGREVERLGLLEPELRAMERAMAAHETNYKLYLTKFEESRVSNAMDAAKMVSVSVLEPPRPPLGPVPARKAFKILVSMCIGAVASLGLAFLIEYFDQTYKVPEDIRDSLAVPVLGAVRDLPSREMEAVEALAVSPGSPIHYQTIKSSVVMRAEEKDLKMVAVCSPTPKEGSSTVVINLGASLVKDSERRVILVDANFRHPSLHTNFNLPGGPGFSDVIRENLDVLEAVQESLIPNLFVLTGGISIQNPMAILESENMNEVIEVLGREFDWIIFDCAPIKHFPDSSVLARRLGGTMGVVLVVQAEHKHADIAVQAKERMEEAGGKILGAVLNRQRYVIPETVYRRL